MMRLATPPKSQIALTSGWWRSMSLEGKGKRLSPTGREDGKHFPNRLKSNMHKDPGRLFQYFSPQ